MAVLVTYQIIVIVLVIGIVYTNCEECIPKSPICSPVTVHIVTSEENDIREIRPLSVEVKRCLGKFGRKSCVAKTKIHKSFNVTINGNCSTIKKVYHTSCKMVKLQLPNEQDDKQKNKKCPPRKRWNKEQQNCVCKKKCTSTSNQLHNDDCKCK